MPRPRQEPHALFRRDRGRWVIVDGRDRIPIEPPLTTRSAVDEAAAKVAVARYVVAKANAASASAPVVARPASQVTVEEVLDLYVSKRTDPDPKVRVYEVARPEEVKQRARALRPLWPVAVTALSEQLLRGFARDLGSASYARRCLADLQAGLTEAQAHPLFHETIRLWLPPPSESREDVLSVEEILAILRVCTRRRERQQRRIGGRIQIVDGRRKLVGGKLEFVYGAKRPWAHVAKFLIVALATCSRSARVFEASYQPEVGRPWVDLERGVMYRRWTGERRTKKRAPTIPLPPRLVDAMRRWSTDRVVDGRLRKGDRYVVQWNSKPANCKKGWSLALAEAKAQYPHLFKRDDGTEKSIVRHTLRHTGVTMLADIPELTVEEVCAYAGMTKAMFERVYGHSEKSMSAKVAGAMGKKRKPKKKED